MQGTRGRRDSPEDGLSQIIGQARTCTNGKLELSYHQWRMSSGSNTSGNDNNGSN